MRQSYSAPLFLSCFIKLTTIQPKNYVSSASVQEARFSFGALFFDIAGEIDPYKSVALHIYLGELIAQRLMNTFVFHGIVGVEDTANDAEIRFKEI